MVLQASVSTLAVWIPAQLTINHFFTKISIHAGVMAGCVTALVFLQVLHPIVQAMLILMVPLVLWSRHVTKNHTLTQLLLGLLVGGGSVLIVFPWFLGRL